MRPSPIPAYFLFALVAATPVTAAADFTGIASETTGLVYTRAGHATDTNALALGYAARLAPESVECPAGAFIEVGLEAHDDTRPFEPDTGSLRAGLRVELVRAGRFALPAQGSLAIGMNLTGLLRVAFRTDAALMPGYYAGRGLVAAELGLRSTWGEVATGNDENTVEGWTTTASQSLRVGVRVGVVLASRVELVARTGYDDITHGSRRAPTYVDVSAGVRF